MSAAAVQLAIASGAFGESTDNYTATLRAQHGGRLRIKSQRTHWTHWLAWFQAVRVGRLTVVMIYRLGGECFDGKRVRDDLDGSSGRAILARGGRTGLRGLHGIFSTEVSTGHKTRREGYKMLESTRWRSDRKRVECTHKIVPNRAAHGLSALRTPGTPTCAIPVPRFQRLLNQPFAILSRNI